MSFRHPELCINIDRALHATAYYAFEHIYKKQIFIEFIYAKVFAIYYKQF